MFRNSIGILLGVFVLSSLAFATRTAVADGYGREGGRRGEDCRVEEMRRHEEERRLAEERRIAEERRLHPVPVYVPAPVVVAPPPPSPGISLVIPISFH